MSLDEYCLMNMNKEVPFFYLWQNDPTVVIGAHQNVYKEIDLQYLQDNNIHLVRRMSGGGAVYHDKGNLNFTFIGKIQEGEDEFRKYVQYIVDALQLMGLEGVELTGRNDITMHGNKISGCAKRNYQNRCMVHGTLLWDVDTSVLKNVLNGPLSKMKLRGTDSVRKEVANIAISLPKILTVAEFTLALQRLLQGDDGQEIYLSEEQKRGVEEIARTKYRQEQWIYGRNPKSNISYTHRFTCGTVSIDIMVENNSILDINFSGDFIGRTKPSELEDKLKGVEYSTHAVHEVVDASLLHNCFDGMTKEQFISFMFGCM